MYYWWTLLSYRDRQPHHWQYITVHQVSVCHILLEKPGGTTRTARALFHTGTTGIFPANSCLLCYFICTGKYYWCIPPQYCTYTCVSPWHWPAIDIRSYIEPRGAQLATLALGVVTYSTVWTTEPNWSLVAPFQAEEAGCPLFPNIPRRVQRRD